MHHSKNYGTTFAKGLLRRHDAHQLFKSCMPRFPHYGPVMPGTFDQRQRVAPPENQLGCGGCWDFSITNSLRSFLMLQGRDPGPLSKNYLLLNAGPIREYGCAGGDFSAGQNMLGGRGPCLEELSPYTGRDDGKYPENAPVAATAANWVVVGRCGKPTAQELCEAIWNDGRGACLSVDICANSTIDSYSCGVIEESTGFGVNHMVRLVGWLAGGSVDANGNAAFKPNGDWANRGACFIMRNNWGTEWGVDGDCFIEYGVNDLAETAMVFR